MLIETTNYKVFRPIRLIQHWQHSQFVLLTTSLSVLDKPHLYLAVTQLHSAYSKPVYLGVIKNTTSLSKTEHVVSQLQMKRSLWNVDYTQTTCWYRQRGHIDHTRTHTIEQQNDSLNTNNYKQCPPLHHWQCCLLSLQTLIQS